MRQRPAIGYVLALAGVALATGVGVTLFAVIKHVPFITYFPVVALVTLVGGVRPGMASLLLSAVAANYFMLPPADEFSLGLPGLLVTGLFLLVGGLIFALIGLLNEAVDRMWNQAETGRIILESQPAGVIAVDAEGRITLVNSAVERQLGYSREELLGQSVDMLVPPPLRSEHARSRDLFMEEPTPRRMGAGRDLNAVTKFGALVPVEIGLNPLRQKGRSGALATIVDISERKRLEWRAQVLSSEVRHRSRNLLTVVQALARRMLPRESSTEFMETLASLARTQDIFGTGVTAPLRTVIEGELTGFGDQVELEGCDILLTARAAQDFTLIVHELATNALKYGALSTSKGRVKISGQEADPGAFVFRWEERDGPAVSQPSRKGFGQTILKDLAKGFSTSVEIAYDPDGLAYQLTIPLERIGDPALAGADEGE